MHALCVTHGKSKIKIAPLSYSLSLARECDHARMTTYQERIKLLVTKREAASALSVSIRTIENFIRRKDLAARKIGRRTLIPLASLEAFARRDHASPNNGNGSN